MKQNTFFFAIAIAIILLCSALETKAQQLYFPLGQTVNIKINAAANRLNVPINTGFKPLLSSEINSVANFDSILYQPERQLAFMGLRQLNWFYKKAFFEDFVAIRTENFTLSINPLLNLELGNQNDTSKRFFKNTRGIEFKGTIGEKLAFYSAFRENQAYYRPYVSDFANRRRVTPGQGAHKNFGKDKKGYDFSMATGYISYTPASWVNLQFGHDKNFIGEGHRSLLLSDNAFNYPFAKATFTHKGFKYVNMLTQFEDFQTKYYNYHTKKHGAFHYLSYNFRNRLEIGLFEGAIFQTTDTAAQTINKFPAEFFIPILGTHTALNGFSGSNNVLLGLNFKIKIIDNIQLYGQVALDDPSKKENAFQAGAKVFDVLFGKFKNHNLYFQVEYNLAQKSTYSATNKLENWGHYNQELAHPLGRSFNELFVKTNYRFHNIYIHLSYSQAKTNLDIQQSDIYAPPLLIEAFVQNISHKTLQVGWVFNPKTALQIFVGFDRRQQENRTNDFVFFGLKTDLSNFYYDF